MHLVGLQLLILQTASGRGMLMELKPLVPEC